MLVEAAKEQYGGKVGGGGGGGLSCLSKLRIIGSSYVFSLVLLLKN